jgi:hypothetical protein
MIIEFTKDKLTPRNLNINILNRYKEFFNSNPNIWFKSYEISIKVENTSVRIYVNKLRCEGMSIISHPKLGYKFTNNKTEIKECYELLRNRALRALTAAKRMKKNL